MIVAHRALAIVAYVAGCGGSHHRVVSFDVQPRLACPGQDVTVTWEVDGAARLAIVKGTANPEPPQILAAEKDVVSKASRSFKVDQTTTFVIRAVDANQAEDPWQGSQHVDVNTSDALKAVETTCSGIVCSGTFTVHADHDTATVVRIYEPKLKSGGKASPATIRVTHGALAASSIDPDHAFSTSVPVEGEWKLETTLPDGTPTTPPPGLSIKLQIACP